MREANQWRNFGDYNLHNYLTLEQLDAVREAVPRVINTSYFVNAYMQARPCSIRRLLFCFLFACGVAVLLVTSVGYVGGGR